MVGSHLAAEAVQGSRTRPRRDARPRPRCRARERLARYRRPRVLGTDPGTTAGSDTESVAAVDSGADVRSPRAWGVRSKERMAFARGESAGWLLEPQHTVANLVQECRRERHVTTSAGIADKHGIRVCSVVPLTLQLVLALFQRPGHVHRRHEAN